MNHESVQEYYGETLQTSADLQTNACCTAGDIPDHLKAVLAKIHDEVLAKYYGCGLIAPDALRGMRILDLGSGSGRDVYALAGLVGAAGHVVGVDMTEAQLDVARVHQEYHAHAFGYDKPNTEFHKGLIEHLDDLPLEAGSFDIIVSNCVLNLVNDSDKKQLVEEIFRVVKPGGRIAMSDIVADEAIPDHLKADPELWSGCISGSFLEDEFLESFKQAGFRAVKCDKWDAEPWQVVEGIEFRSVTITAVKGEETPCIDKGHAVIYKGPYAETTDDEGHIFYRGKRMAVCERTYNFLTTGPYGEDFIGISPSKKIEGNPWCAPAGTLRLASDTKGGLHSNAKQGGGCC